MEVFCTHRCKAKWKCRRGIEMPYFPLLSCSSIWRLEMSRGGKMDELECDTVATPPLIETIVLVPIITLRSTTSPKTKLMHAPLHRPTKPKPNSFCHKKQSRKVDTDKYICNCENRRRKCRNSQATRYFLDNWQVTHYFPLVCSGKNNNQVRSTSLMFGVSWRRTL